MAFSAKEFSPTRVTTHVREGVAHASHLLHQTAPLQPEEQEMLDFLVKGGRQVFQASRAEHPVKGKERRPTYQGIAPREIPSALRGKVDAAIAVAQIQGGFTVQFDRLKDPTALGEVGHYIEKGGYSTVFIFDGPYFQEAIYNVEAGIFDMSIAGTGRSADLPEFERAAGFDRKTANPIMASESDLSASSTLVGDFYTPVPHPNGPYYGLRPSPQPIVSRAA